jgi:hypothetical protein
MCFWKIDRVFRFFPSGVFIGEGAATEVDQGGLTHRGVVQGLAAPPQGVAGPWPPSIFSFGLLEASVNIRRFGFCFIQFREYFLCNFSETQK